MSNFHKFLQEHRRGSLHDEICDGLRELVAAVSEEGKSGSLTLKITVKPGGAKSDHLEVADELKVTLPKKVKGTSIFYATPENDLVREDPRQTKMELREIGPSSPARSLA